MTTAKTLESAAVASLVGRFSLDSWALRPTCSPRPHGSVFGQRQQDEAAANFLNTASVRLGWSGLSIHRCLKVALTVADLAGVAKVQVTHIAEAVRYRRAIKAH